MIIKLLQTDESDIGHVLEGTLEPGKTTEQNCRLSFSIRIHHLRHNIRKRSRNPFASGLAGLLFSKGLNYIKKAPTQLLSQIEDIHWRSKTNTGFKATTTLANKKLAPVCFDVSQELIGEFTGKNIVYRVLPAGKIETTNQGTDKIMEVNAIIMSIAIGSMENGSFVGEINSLISTAMDETVMLKGNGVSGQSENGILTMAATYQITKAEQFARLNKMLLLHEYVTDMEDNWTGKIWKWK